ncbi:MAG TPA: hypothetical protein VN698_14125 [Bacteroidia bacterium]|nr:hypothetical protein [Bacteroidia bacterium]
MSYPSIIAIIAYIFLAIVASIPLYENFKKYSRAKKVFITFSVICLFCFGGLDVYNKVSDPEELSKIVTSLKKIMTAIEGKTIVQQTSQII